MSAAFKITSSKASPARGNQGTASLWLDSKLSLQDAPPVVGALGVIGVCGRTDLTRSDYIILNNMFI
jgi:hypothetical protein